MGSFFRVFERGVRKAFRDPRLAGVIFAAAVVLALIKAREEDGG